MLSKQQRIDILNRDRWQCVENGCNRTWNAGYMLEINHITPVARGGTDDSSNLETLCREHHLQYHEEIGDKAGARLIRDRIETKGVMRYGFG